MNIIIRKVNEYAEVTIEEGNTSIYLGLLDIGEAYGLVSELNNAAEELMGVFPEQVEDKK